MKFHYLCFLSLCAALLSGQNPGLHKKMEAPAVSFTENKGQVSDQYHQVRTDILFSGAAENMNYYLRSNGISYQFQHILKWVEKTDRKTGAKMQLPDQRTIYRLDLNWINCNSRAKIVKEGELPGLEHYYMDVCPDGVLNVKNYSGLVYKDLYKGIDLHYYSKEGSLKYDYIVAAGADYKLIKIRVEGAQKISLTATGDLKIETPFGEIIEQAPLVQQSGTVLRSAWVLEENVLGFNVVGMDPGKELIIDPLVRSWGTYYGDISAASHCVTDNSNNVFMSGSCLSSSLIATSGSHQVSHGGGLEDAFLVKFNASGSRIWATYYGGSGIDRGYSCAVDGNGDVYLTGSTSSTNAIATAGAHQTVFAAVDDAYLVKFNANGIRQWGTYYGDYDADAGYDCATDASGNVFMVGYTESSIGITSAGSHQSAFGGGTSDGFIVKFSGTGIRHWASYYGGTGFQMEGILGCAVDYNGDLYVSGNTESANAIATNASHQTTFTGAGAAFLAKFNTSGTRIWGTYYGGAGPGYDSGNDCAADPWGNIYLAGYCAISGTTSTSQASVQIATPNGHQPLPGGGQLSVFLAKFDSTGHRHWGTYYGGPAVSRGGNCTTDALGNVFLSGYTDLATGTIIATPPNHQPLFGGGSGDAFIAKFDSAGVRQWGSFYGGSGDEGGSCAIDNNGLIYLTGGSGSPNNIATPGSHQPSVFSNNSTAFLVQFFECQSPSLTVSSSHTVVCAGESATLTAGGAATFTWEPAASGVSVVITPASNTTYTLTGSDAAGCPAYTTLTQSVAVLPTLSIASTRSVICSGEKVVLTGSGATNYTWSSGGNAVSTTVTPVSTSSYTLSGTDANGCKGTAVYSQSVNICQSLTEWDELSDVRLFPNPASGAVSIRVTAGSQLSITDLSGRLVQQGDLSTGTNTVDVSMLSTGCYLLRITSGSQARTFKLIKE